VDFRQTREFAVRCRITAHPHACTVRSYAKKCGGYRAIAAGESLRTRISEFFDCEQTRNDSMLRCDACMVGSDLVRRRPVTFELTASKLCIWRMRFRCLQSAHRACDRYPVSHGRALRERTHSGLKGGRRPLLGSTEKMRAPSQVPANLVGFELPAEVGAHTVKYAQRGLNLLRSAPLLHLHRHNIGSSWHNLSLYPGVAARHAHGMPKPCCYPSRGKSPTTWRYACTSHSIYCVGVSAA
jgi:hypothetical protein